jgi:hypothetical protein
MVMVANEPPYSVCIGKSVASGQVPVSQQEIAGCQHLAIGKFFPIAIPVPAPPGTGRIEHLKTAISF